MNRAPFVRKLMYLGAIALLLVPLSYFSQPATVAAKSEKASAGGRLAQLQSKYRLSQASLGEIDPTSETMRLATLGLRGVASLFLWEKANEHKMKEDWTGFQAVLDQLSKLQPNYIGVWRYQAWNVSFNISVEWDDFNDRYFWVKEGVKFLMKGSRYNENEPRLLYDTAWFTAQKIGMADEKLQYRKLFRLDPDEEYPDHRRRPVDRRDNWLVGQEFYRAAHHVVQDLGVSLGSMNPLTFYAEPAKCQINFGTAIEEEGIFGERARLAWEDAARQWTAYGSMALRGRDQTTIRMKDLERIEKRLEKAGADLDALDPGLRDRIHDEKVAKLSEKDRLAFETPLEERDADQYSDAMMAEQLTVTSADEVAARIKGKKGNEARRLATRMRDLETLKYATQSAREMVSYPYWEMRCNVEKTKSALEGRRLLYEGKQALVDADLLRARESYEKAFKNWKRVLDEFPAMMEDNVGSDSLVESLEGYAKVLKQLDEPFPDNFILMDFILARRPKYTPPEGYQDPNAGSIFANPRPDAGTGDGPTAESADQPDQPAPPGQSGEPQVKPDE